MTLSDIIKRLKAREKNDELFLPSRRPPPPKEVTKPMEVSMCFDDGFMMTYLEAKLCMEMELDREICNDECIGRLAEMYLDVRKGEKVVYDTDEE